MAASTGTFYGRPMAAGHIYAIAGNGGPASGDGGPVSRAVLSPLAMVTDGAGNLVASGTQRIRVVAATTGTFYGQAMTAGHIYTITGNGRAGFSGDGGPGTAAELDLPTGLAVDVAGNVLIADNQNNRVRAVAATTGTFYGQAMTAGHIYTIAGDGGTGFSGDGGPATKAKLFGPSAVVPDAAGNLLITDTFNERVRVVAASTGTFYGQAMTAGHIYTVAGDGTLGFAGDGGLATSAELQFPGYLAVDAAGNVLLSDTSNNRVRVVAATTGTFYGTAMTAGHIYAIAGNGTPGFSGDGGPATKAGLNGPNGVAVNTAGDLLIADSDNNRVREVTG